jgi:methionine--tRNA ligase beta chain
MKGDEQAEARQVVVRSVLESLYVLAHFLLPFVPIGASSVFEMLHTQPTSKLSGLDFTCRNLVTGTTIDSGRILYTPVGGKAEEPGAAEPKESFAAAQERKKAEKAKKIAANAKVDEADLSNQPEFTKIDIRVGKIVDVWNHAEADKLFCEKIDVGEESGPREIASGLRNFYSLEDMKDRKVLVVCNLKAAKIVGFTSNGMVLAAKSEDGSKVELIDAPADAEVGERVRIDGLEGEPLTAPQVKKKKTWETVAKGLLTNDSCVATWEGKEIRTKAGVCKSASLVGAAIS